MASTSKKIFTASRHQSVGVIKLLVCPLIFNIIICLSANLLLIHNLSRSQNDTSLQDSILINSNSFCSIFSADEREDNESVINSIEYNLKTFSSSKQKSNKKKTLLLSTCTKLFDKLDLYFKKVALSLQKSSVIFAEASSLYQQNQDKEIIILNSTNFNSEIVQTHSPFPHIKLIEFYVSYCGFCVKFKTVFTKLSKEIYSWRNVIRLSAIDLGISSNSPIVHSWSVDVVPTLRILPPPNKTLSIKLDEKQQYLSKTYSSSEIHKLIFEELNSSNLTKQSLNAAQYLDKVSLLKYDLLNYIELYIINNSNQFPDTWPNLMPIKETSLFELRQKHPRKELYIIIERDNLPISDSEITIKNSSFGLNVLMDLSSSAAWKAVRYVKLSDNRALIEDVILQLNKSTKRQKYINQTLESEKQTNEPIRIDDLLTNETFQLIHIDDSHSPTKLIENSLVPPSITLLSGSDLLNFYNSVEKDFANDIKRSKRFTDYSDEIKYSMIFNQGDIKQFEDIKFEKRVELLALYIKHSYSEINEDRLFMKLLSIFDRDISLRETNNQFISSENLKIDKISNDLPLKQYELDKTGYKMFKNFDCDSDYLDKLKAIRYALFNEIPRSLFSDKTSTEIQVKFNTILNFVTVIKLYFPLPDLASTQFIDGVQAYMLEQQTKMLSMNNQERGLTILDSRTFKKELKRLEISGKKLPDIDDWKFCKLSGYPCALWRLFHTLAAFEFIKLSQINHQPMLEIKNTQAKSGSLSQLSGKSEFPNLKLGEQQQQFFKYNQTNKLNPAIVKFNSSSNPIERLISPPSTTTSLSLTIASSVSNSESSTNNKLADNEADLPMPVLLVMKDYISNFFSCEECSKNFRMESADLNQDRIRQLEPVDFSVIWLWETHNRINKRLSVDDGTNPLDHPKVWFPTYDQCPKCYNKPPSFLNDATIDSASKFHESIEWNKQEVLRYLIAEYTKQPMDNFTNIFGYSIPLSFGFIIISCLCCISFIMILRLASNYIERQKRHKATLLNGNGIHYSLEMR